MNLTVSVVEKGSDRGDMNDQKLSKVYLFMSSLVKCKDQSKAKMILKEGGEVACSCKYDSKADLLTISIPDPQDLTDIDKLLIEQS